MDSEDRTGVRLMRTALLCALGIFVVFAIDGCSTGPAIINEWRNPAYGAAYFKRIMVAGPAGQATLRRNVEDEFVARLRASGIDALPSYRYISEDEKIDENNLKQAAQKAGADALLYVRAMRMDVKTEYPNYFPYSWFGVSGSNFGVSWSGPSSGPGPYRYNEYTSETTLYDVSKNEAVWSATIKTTERESERAAIDSYVETVVKTLDEKNLVRQRQ
ncbi:MAG: hypothetical protein ACM3TN_25930 [Alphaproteobacteria bacterium]